VDEFEIIRRLFTPANTSASVIVGVGDDGAILRPEPGHDLISVVDTMVAGVHFPASLHPEDIGYRAVAVNVSDIAAMGGRPRWMTVALTLHDAGPNWLESFARGISVAAAAFGVDLVGGDITRGVEFVVSVQVNGDVKPGQAITRSGANAGDGIYVSGTPGDAALGLSLIQSLQPEAPLTKSAAYLVRRFSRPDARVGLGQAIAPVACAAIDLSDGLYADLAKLLSASGVSGSIELNDIPLSEELQSTIDWEDAIRFALGGGDDYELCFTAAVDDIDESCVVAGVPVTRIGFVGEGSGLACTLDGSAYDYHDHGYRHFS
jgi:thiamine-monophosphate kinase